VSDRYAQLVNAPLASRLARSVGLPQPVALERYRPGDPVIRGRVLLGAAPGGRLAQALAQVLAEIGAEVVTSMDEPVRSAVAQAGIDAAVFDPGAPGEGGDSASGGRRYKALVLDATGIVDSTELVALQAFYHPTVRRIERCGRAIVLGTPPGECASTREATAQRAIEGFTRSLGKEIGRGATVQLVQVSPGAERNIDSTLRFLCSPRSAYVSGQVVHVGTTAGATAASAPEFDSERPFAGRIALVTGAARGIGAAIAETLARDGAHVVGLDVPALGGELRAVTQRLKGEALELDITTAEAPAASAQRLADGVDVVVHNAGVTRDRTLAKMPAERWSELMEINLSAQERIDDALLAVGALREHGRIVCVSSMSGIAGNAGQTNYATSKAGVIGRVQALAPELASRGQTINAVAPGFIETQMTARMPIAIREAGRRMSSLRQGGLPIDVAETIAWLAHPGSGGVTGNVVRVCGQNLLGA
jgi:3-oxoacyl-[acyl-carrier protein] reductase